MPKIIENHFFDETRYIVSEPLLKLSNWSVTSRDNNPYLAPELRTISLKGHIDHHPVLGDRIEKGDVVTSSIVEVNGRFVRTKSNHIYKLGKIDPKYRQWLRENRPNWDWRNPIIMKG